VKKQLIVTADDFGLTEKINEGIVQAHRNGVVTSASLMVNGGAFESAVALAHRNPGLDLGLHLNLTHRPMQLVRQLAQGKISTGALEKAIREQIEKAIGTGLAISHVDGHKHVHVIPQVLDIVRRLAPTYGIRAIRSMATVTPRLGSLLARNSKSRSAILKQYILGVSASCLWRLSWRKNSILPMAGPDRFYGIAETGFLDLQAFADIIDHLTPGVNEVMCHPGYVDEALSKIPTRLRTQRERELEMLTCPQVRGLINNADVHLISYRDLAATN